MIVFLLDVNILCHVMATPETVLKPKGPKSRPSWLLATGKAFSRSKKTVQQIGSHRVQTFDPE